MRGSVNKIKPIFLRNRSVRSPMILPSCLQSGEPVFFPFAVPELLFSGSTDLYAEYTDRKAADNTQRICS